MNTTDTSLSEVVISMKDLNVKESEFNRLDKEWRVNLSTNQRANYTKNLYEALVNSGFAGDAATTARSIESKFFDIAKSRADYYCMVAEELYRICKAYEGSLVQN